MQFLLLLFWSRTILRVNFERWAPMAVIPRFARWSNRRDYSSVVECSFLLPHGSRRQPPLVEYIAPAAAVSRGAGFSTDHGLGVDPGPSSTVAVFVTIRIDMSVDERSLAYAHGGVSL